MKTFAFLFSVVFTFVGMLSPVKTFGEKPEGKTLPQTIVSPIDAAEMVLVPAGDFLRGTTDAQVAELLRRHPSLTRETFKHEQPARRLYLDAYYIDKYEVTVGQYKRFLAATGHPEPDWSLIRHFSLTDAHPITYVSWEDAVAYASWAGKQESRLGSRSYGVCGYSPCHGWEAVPTGAWLQSRSRGWEAVPTGAGL